MAESPDIRYLFEPRGVAIIGASRDPNKIGHKFVQNIIASGYKGGIFPVNPQGGEILGMLDKLNADGVTVIMVTHDDTLGARGTRHVRLRDGNVESDDRRTG